MARRARIKAFPAILMASLLAAVVLQVSLIVGTYHLYLVDETDAAADFPALLRKGTRPTITSSTASVKALPVPHTSTTPTTADADKSKSKCSWLLLAGDSNTRIVAAFVMRKHEAYYNVTNVLTAQRSQPMQEWQQQQQHLKKQQQLHMPMDCGPTWADREWVVMEGDGTSSGSCHIVTQRFLRNQDEIHRLATNINDGTYVNCNTTLNDPLADVDEYVRPAMPDVIWFSHGLWNLPNGGSNSSGLTCQDRFRDVVPALTAWSSMKDRVGRPRKVVWQTNFPILGHSTIRNEYLEWEVQCQRNLARDAGIDLYDLDGIVRPRFPESVEVYHIARDVAIGVADHVFHETINVSMNAIV